MAARTSSQAGPWELSSTWGGAVPPGDGDTFTANHAITINSAVTVGTGVDGIIGAGSGTITVQTGSFTTKGWLFSSTLTLIMEAGTTRSWHGGGAGSAYFDQLRKFKANGTSGSHVTVNTTGGVKYGFFFGGAHNVMEMDCTYTDFSGVGDMAGGFFNACGSPFVLTNCTFDNCTKFIHTGSSATDILNVYNNVWSSTRDIISNLRLVGMVAPTGGTLRNISLNSFSHNLEFFGDLTDLVFEDNLVSPAIPGSVVVEFGQPGTTTTTGIISRCKNNVIIGTGWTDGLIYNCVTGRFTRNLTHAIAGQHMGVHPDQAGTLEFDNNICETGEDTGAGQVIYLPNDGLQPVLTVNIHNNIQIPGPGGVNAQTFLLHTGIPKNLTITINHNNMSTGMIIGSYSGAASYCHRSGMLTSFQSNILKAHSSATSYLLEQGPQNRSARIGANIDAFDKGTLTAADATSFTDSTASWGTVFTDVIGFYIIITSGLASGLATLITSNTSGTKGNVSAWAGGITPAGTETYLIVPADLYDPNNVGHNCSLNGKATGIIHRLNNTDVSSIQNYDGHYITSGSPGTGDLWSTDPQYVDSTRCLATYDIDGLGNTIGTVWADTGLTYNVGDIVSSATSTFYGNKTINYRCISAHAPTSVANDKPGSGSAWRTYWEFATVHRIRQDRTKISTMIDWIQAGFKPTNTLLRNTGHDLVTIGAMDYYSSSETSDTVIRAVSSSVVKLGTATVNTSGKKFKQYSGRSQTDPNGEMPTNFELKLTSRFDDKNFYRFNR